MARALLPAHTPFDGDLVFAVSTGEHRGEIGQQDVLALGHAAAICLARAIARGVYAAESLPGDILPNWQSLYGDLSANNHQA